MKEKEEKEEEEEEKEKGPALPSQWSEKLHKSVFSPLAPPTQANNPSRTEPLSKQDSKVLPDVCEERSGRIHPPSSHKLS